MKKSIALKIKNLSLKKSNQNILTEVSFTLPTSCLASIIGPTGAGKTSIIHHLLEQMPALSFSVSACSREKRDNENEGEDYFVYLNNDAYVLFEL